MTQSVTQTDISQDVSLQSKPNTDSLPLTDQGSRVGRVVSRVKSLVGPGTRDTFLALADQAVVSGTSLITTVLIGRICGLHELGLYSLGMSLLIVVMVLQDSLIVLPYTIYSPRLKGNALQQYSGSVLLHQAVLTVTAMVVFAVMAIGCALGLGPDGLGHVMWMIAAIVPFWSLREYVRRYVFARLSVWIVLSFDVAVTTLQIGGLIWLASLNQLSAVTGYVSIGVACCVLTTGWLVHTAKQFRYNWRHSRADFKKHWNFGRWMCAGQVIGALQVYAIYWLLTGLLDETATGMYAACMSVAMLFNPVILGIGNVLAPKASRAQAEDGPAEVRRVIWKTTLLLGLAQTFFTIIVMLGGSFALHLLYDEPVVPGEQWLITVLALALLSGGISFAAENGLWVIERPDMIFKSRLLGLILTVGATLALVPIWGVIGAAVGLLVGNLTVSIICGVAFTRLIRHLSAEGAAA